MSNNNAMTSWEEGSLRVTMTKDDFIHKRRILPEFSQTGKIWTDGMYGSEVQIRK